MRIEDLPKGFHYTFQNRYNTCGKPTCSVCRSGKKHGPYRYAVYTGEDKKQHSVYLGKPNV